MSDMPVNEFVEIRNGGYYLAGIRFTLDSIAYALKRGENLDQILENFPALIGREELVKGGIAFIHTYQSEVDAYLKRQAERYEELQRQNPLPPELAERFRRYREQKDLKSA
jgi:hypothetical protein